MEEVTRTFRATGGSLTDFHPFGHDPLHGYEDLIQTRSIRFFQQAGKSEEIFDNVMRGQGVSFEYAICIFQNITIDLTPV